MPDVAANTGGHGMTTLVKHHPVGVPIHLFTRHVLERHANDKEGFIAAFEHIECNSSSKTQDPTTNSPKKENLASLLPQNVHKNRYKNVLACKQRHSFYIGSSALAHKL